MQNEIKPRALNDYEKYAILGQLEDIQRGCMYEIIKRSRANQWTRYSDFPDHLSNPNSRMCEIYPLAEKFGLHVRDVLTTDINGRQVHLTEFCVAWAQEDQVNTRQSF